MKIILASITRTLILVLIGITLWACGLGVTPAGPEATPSSIPLPTHTPQPPATPTPTPQPPVVALLAPEGADEAQVRALQQTLAGLIDSAENGWRLQVLPALDPGELENARIVVAVPPAANLGELAAAAPETQFLALGIPGVEPAANLSVIGGQGERPDLMAFLAGYVAASITPDWRAGVVVEPQSVAGKGTSLAFANGVKYFCGLCLPAYPPFPRSGYPLVVEVAPGAAADQWQEQITTLQTWGVQTVYVQPQVAQEELLADLANSGINFIIAGPPPGGLRQHWIASLSSGDPMLELGSVWEQLLAGQGGQSVSLPLGFSAVNPDLLSPGRQGMAEDMLADLLSGFIHTGVDPLTGESNP